MILIFAFGLSINPYYFSNGLVLTAVVIAIVNNYINMTILTYPSIIICYLAALTFNEKHKIKILFIVVLALYIVFGFVVLPAIYSSLAIDSKIAYFYIFPLLIFIFTTAK